MALRRICSQVFREAILKEYPGLQNNNLFWRHIDRLLFCKAHQVADDNGVTVLGIPISQRHIAFDFKAMSEFHNNRFCALYYIEKFRTQVFKYKLIEYDYNNSKCRYAVPNFSSKIERLIERERDKVYKNNRKVLIENGNILTPEIKRAIRKEDKEYAKIISKMHYMPEVATKIQNYLNDLPVNKFSSICKHIPEAELALYDKDANGNFIINVAAQKDQRDIIESLICQPQPFYVPSSKGNTVRLFEINKGLQGIHSHLRHILTQDSVEVDIQNAHLAIIAKLWNIQEIQDFLSTGKSIWEELLPAMGYEYPNPVLKAQLKDFFYGLIYGMSLKTLEVGMTQVFGYTPFMKFYKHPLVIAVKEGRNKRLKELRSKKLHVTPLGKEVKPYCYTDKDGYFESNLTSILSQEANELEMLLLEPIFDLCLSSKEMTIVLYQFDGLTINFQKRSRRLPLIKKLKKLVEERAESLGIITTLTYSIPS